MDCLRGGFAGPELDMAAVLTVASAQAVPAPIAASLASAFVAGVAAGRAARDTATTANAEEGT